MAPFENKKIKKKNKKQIWSSGIFCFVFSHTNQFENVLKDKNKQINIDVVFIFTFFFARTYGVIFFFNFFFEGGNYKNEWCTF